MKLLLHNLLSSKFLNGVKTGYPLILRVTKTEVKIKNYLLHFQFKKLDLNDKEEERKLFVQQMMPKIDYDAFKNAVSVVDPKQNDLPEKLPEDWKTDSSFLNKVKHCQKHLIVIQICRFTAGWSEWKLLKANWNARKPIEFFQ